MVDQQNKMMEEGQTQEYIEEESIITKQKELVDHLNSIGHSGYLNECINPENGMSILDLVCYTENESMLKAMTKEVTYFGDIVNLASDLNGGWTPLLWTSQRCNLEMAQILVNNEAKIDLAKEEDGMTVFHICASNNDVQMLDYFLEQTGEESTPANFANNEGWTPAHFASFLNNFDSLNLLITYGADLCAKHHGNMKVYEEMARADNADLLECVYRPWVEQDQQKRDHHIDGSFGLIHLAASSETTKVLQFLLGKAKESPNQHCNMRDKSTPLHFAILQNRLDSAKVLLRFGANPNARDALGNSPLHLAVMQKLPRAVKLLEEFGSDGRLQNNDGLCPIEQSIVDDIKDIKMYFMSLGKYKSYDFSK